MSADNIRPQRLWPVTPRDGQFPWPDHVTYPPRAGHCGDVDGRLPNYTRVWELPIGDTPGEREAGVAEFDPRPNVTVPRMSNRLTRDEE